MSYIVRAFAVLMLLVPSTQLFGIEVCFVNDSDRTAIVTVISGSERFEKRLKPKTHAFVTLADTKDDRVVIAQTVDELSPENVSASTKVVDTKVLSEHVNRWNFCYVHGNEADGRQLDLLAYVCLDIVAQSWGKEPSDARFADVKAKLIKSLSSTTEIEPASDANLKKFVRQFSLADNSDTTKLPVNQ